MKTILKYIVLSILVSLFVIQTKAQEQKPEVPTSSINTVARYIQLENSVEMRFVPDKKAVLYAGLKDGFIIERADITVLKEGIESIDDLEFTKVGESKAYNEEQWKNALLKGDAKNKKDLELAKEFFESIDEKRGGNFSFDEGIKAMKEQKSKEDIEYLIFVMNAIKNKNVAKALGIAFTDSTVEKNKTYIYRVKLVKQSKLYQTMATPFTIETSDSEKDKKRKIYVKAGDTLLNFLWEENDMVSGVLVERKNNTTGQWESLTKTTIYTLTSSNRKTFIDKGLINYQTYEYRFYGFNPFGEKVLFGEAKGMPRDLTPPKKPLLKLAKHTKPNEISIKWDIQKPEDSDLKGFVVARGEDNRGKFSIIHKDLLAKSTRSFTDKTFKKDRTNYYVIQAIDTAGNVSSTIPAFVTIIDSIPPTKPKFIKGKIDSLGVVTLDVRLNKEKDLMGYRLFRSNSEKHEFSVIQEGFDANDSIPKPVQIVFKDTVTLNSLTPYIYYRIKALDKNYNQSPFSDILKVKRPDKIAPTIPVFKNVKVRTDAVELYFALSNSIDVVEQNIYRRLSFDEPWVFLSKLKNDQKKYIDKNLKQGIKYYYTLRAKDDSDNYSKYAVAVYGMPYDDGVRPVVTNFKATNDKEKKTVSLNWDYPKKYKDAYYAIYKKNKKGQLVQYKSVSSKNFKETLKKGKHEYGIKVFTKDGGESKISEILTVEIR